jgi:acetylornithine deacetylase/succinyl-diaminopimelate desuccinylase-like protein
MTPISSEQFVAQHAARFREELFEFLRIPSVSARSEHQGDVQRCAEWLLAELQRIGLAASLHPTAGHPVVLGEWRGAGPGARTILVYGHYDVQPAEPLELWESPPFDPVLRGGRIYARGSVDDKGQLFAHVKALEVLLQENGRLPCNVVVLAEGEEEVGSEHLAAFVEEQASRLACDAVVISDSAMFAPGQPSILSSLRGLAYFQIDVEGPTTDLHSGSYGGAVVNPALALARMLATLHDGSGHIAIPGFYDAVRTLGPAECAALRGLPFDDEHFRAETGATALGGEAGYTTLERIWTRPTCEVNGVLSGYTGEGAKTVLPSRAMAKVSCRLVPDQTPEVIEGLLRAHLAAVTPPGIQVTLRSLSGGRPWRASLEGWMYDAARRALAAAFGREPVIVGEGGSIPVVHDFARVLRAPVVLMGFGLPGENAHAPNEWIADENYLGGIRAAIAFLREVGGASTR